MSKVAASSTQLLCQLDNDCRAQVFDVISLADIEGSTQVRQINAFCKALFRLFPVSQHGDIVRAKNQEIKRTWQLVRLKKRSVVLMYIGLKEQMQRCDEHPALRSELCERYKPVLFHRNMLAASDVSLLPGSVVLPLIDTLDRTSQFYELLGEIHRVKTSIQRLLRCNDTIDTPALLDTCTRLEHAHCPPIPLLNSKWNSYLSAAEVLLSQVNLAKAQLYHLHSTLPDSEPLPFQADLQLYSENCLTLATDLRDEGETLSSGYWLSVAQRINSCLGTSNVTVDIDYAEALSSAGKHAKALSVLKSSDQSSDRAYIILLIARAHRDLAHYEKAVKWYQRLFLLNPEVVADMPIEVSYVLRDLCRFEESEALLIGLSAESEADTSLCNAFGFLYVSCG